jgi:acid phosphatase (class A)
MFRKLHRSALALLLALGGVLPPLSAQSARSATATATAAADDRAALVGDYPPLGSDGAKADLAVLLWLQRCRTPEEVARARSEVNLRLGLFAEVTGMDLEGGRFPLTRALCEEAWAALGPELHHLKHHYARPRPYVSWPELEPAVQREPSSAYPSGHASWGLLEASLLASLEPSRAEAILARGRQVGYDRVLAGAHHPSDVVAGQRLAAAFAEAWLADPGNRARMQRARAAEW